MPTHAEKRLLPQKPEQLFELVADVERYPEFLPWCIGARIKRWESDTVFHADLVIGFKMVRERFTSRVELVDKNQINVTYTDGPFRYLNNHWRFDPEGSGTCLDFYVDFEFRSKVLQKLIGALFNEAVQRMVAAFERRADELYGA